MSDYPMLISNKLHSFRNFSPQIYEKSQILLHQRTHVVSALYILKDWMIFFHLSAQSQCVSIGHIIQ